jgi:hypothetical protein
MTRHMATSWLLTPVQRTLAQPDTPCQPSEKLPAPQNSRSPPALGSEAPPGICPQWS